MTKPEHAPTRVAIVGAGFIAQYHVAGIRAAGGRVAAIVGRNRATTAARAAALGVARAETDLRAVLDDPGIDAVVIATPDNTHHDLAIAALRAGKPVLLQKPMALGSTQCAAIIAASRQTRVSLSVSFMHRYFPEVRWLKAQLDAGALGNIHAIRIRNATPGPDWSDWFYRPGAVSGGVVMQLGVHGIDLCQHLFGPITAVWAQTRTAAAQRMLQEGPPVHSNLEDNALASYTLPNAALVSHEMSCTELAGCDRFRLELQTDAGSVWLRTDKGAAAVYAPQLTGRAEWVRPDQPDEPMGMAHHRHWLAVAAGQAAPDDTAQAGLSSIMVAEAIYQSSREGRLVQLPNGKEQ